MSMTEVVANGGNVVQVYDSGVIDTLTQAETTSEFLVSVYSGGYISNLTATRVSAVLIPGGAVGTAHLGGINSSCFIISGGSLGELHTTSTTCAVSNGAHVGTLYQSAFGGTVWRADAVCSNAYVYANHFRVSSGAVVSAITVYSGGNLSVYVGGTALGVINSGGSVRVQDGGYIEYATP